MLGTRATPASSDWSRRATATRRCRRSMFEATSSRRWPNASRCYPVACTKSGQTGGAGIRPGNCAAEARRGQRLSTIHHGRVHRVEGAQLVDLHMTAQMPRSVPASRACIAIRDHARALLDAQLVQDGDEGAGPPENHAGQYLRPLCGAPRLPEHAPTRWPSARPGLPAAAVV